MTSTAERAQLAVEGGALGDEEAVKMAFGDSP